MGAMDWVSSSLQQFHCIPLLYFILKLIYLFREREHAGEGERERERGREREREGERESQASSPLSAQSPTQALTNCETITGAQVGRLTD